MSSRLRRDQDVRLFQTLETETFNLKNRDETKTFQKNVSIPFRGRDVQDYIPGNLVHSFPNKFATQSYKPFPPDLNNVYAVLLSRPSSLIFFKRTWPTLTPTSFGSYFSVSTAPSWKIVTVSAIHRCSIYLYRHASSTYRRTITSLLRSAVSSAMRLQILAFRTSSRMDSLISCPAASNSSFCTVGEMYWALVTQFSKWSCRDWSPL